MQKHGTIACWIVDDTGFLRNGTHSVGVARQYCGQVGKQDNCRVAVSLSLATRSSSLPIAYRLYLPEVWANDKKRRQQAGIPESVKFQTKTQIALDQIRQAVAEDIPRGVLVADAGYGNDGQFRSEVRRLGLDYVVGVQSSVTVWEPGTRPLPPLPRKRMGRPPRLLRRDKDHQPVSAKQLADPLPRDVDDGYLARGREAQAPLPLRRRAHPSGPSRLLAGRASCRRMAPYRVAKGKSEPTKYWLSTLPYSTKLKDLVALAKQRWIIERDHQELKQELGLGHYEGRGWRGFHHHATLNTGHRSPGCPRQQDKSAGTLIF